MLNIISYIKLINEIKDVLIAPYDGGVDIIVGNYRELMFYAEKYASWV